MYDRKNLVLAACVFLPEAIVLVKNRFFNVQEQVLAVPALD